MDDNSQTQPELMWNNVRLRFRNYIPHDKYLQEYIDKESFYENDQWMKQEDSLTILKKEYEKLSTNEINIVPKKPNSDLKSQCNSKLNKLKKRTQKTLVEMLRENMAKVDDK